MRTYDICFAHYSNIQIEAKSKREAIKKFNRLAEKWAENDDEMGGTYEISMVGFFDKDGNIKELKVPKSKYGSM